MRISDWSSDVCSSDLDDDGLAGKGTGRGGRERDGARGSGDRSTLDQRAHCREAGFVDALRDQVGQLALAARRRTEARGPAPEGAVAVGHRLQRDLGDIVVERHLAFNDGIRSEEHTSELQSLMRISSAVFCLKKKTHTNKHRYTPH